MTTIVKTTEEIESFTEQQSEIRTELKELVKKQIELKAILRAPHKTYVGTEMYRAQSNAVRITALHSRLNRLYGKPDQKIQQETEVTIIDLSPAERKLEIERLLKEREENKE